MARKSCKIDGCDNIADARGWCRKHYWRWKRNGDPKFVTTYDRRIVTNKNSDEISYVQLRMEDGTYKFEHVVMAEKAIGRELPFGSVVHHVDRDGTNNNTKTPWNLVVCPDQKYHLLLHARARAFGYEALRSGQKITAHQRAEIRSSTLSIAELAGMYGVTKSSIKAIRSSRGRLREKNLGLL